MIFSILISAFIILIFYYWWSNYHRWGLANKIQGPKGLPFVGNTEFFTSSPEKLFLLLAKLHKKYKNYYRVWIGPEFWCVIYEPEIVEKILNNQNFIKSNDYELLKPWLGSGLITSEGNKWFQRRKVITPAFHFKILEDFVDVFSKQTDLLVEKFRKEKCLDIFPHMLLLALDTICESAMGIQIHAQTMADSKYVNAVHNVTRILFRRMFNPLLMIDFIFRLTGDYKIFEQSLKLIHETTDNVINDRRKQLEKSQAFGSTLSEEKDEFGRKRKMALLDVLLRSTIEGNPLTDKEIRDEVNTFMFAGHDTTGSSLSFLLYNIAKYKDVQKKVYEEIYEVFGTAPQAKEVTILQLNNLKYLDLVIKESLRFHTTVPFISRQILEECQIGDVVFPENTNASIFVYGLCHREDIFPKPEKFIPERFDIEYNSDKMHPFSFIPFSAGPRNCIGQRFATLELKTVVTKILQNFEISLENPNEELTLISGLILKTKNGIKIRFEPR